MVSMISELELRLWTDYLLDLPLGAKIVAGCGTVGLLVPGIILHGLVILFERNGGDPQKRGLNNQVSEKNL